MANKDERLGQINIRYISTNTSCSCCNNNFKEEKMWHVSRWGKNKTLTSFFYCVNCAPTKNDVLNIIDTDECEYGIFPIDNVIIRKKTKEEIEKEKKEKNNQKPTMHQKRNKLYKKKVLKRH